MTLVLFLKPFHFSILYHLDSLHSICQEVNRKYLSFYNDVHLREG
jgi:hypothetical protein